MRIYVDTNVYLDYFLERIRSKEALNLFMDAIRCKYEVVLSEQVLFELDRLVDYKETVMFFQILKPKLINVKADEDDFSEARKINTHFADALHIVLARKAGAELVVTRNLKDFSSFKAKRPEEL
jgi:predicted nucleic acid-binding protein